MKIEQFKATLAPESLDESDGSIGLTVYTGATVDRYDPFTGESYTLAMDVTPEAVDLTRVDAGTAPILDSHSDYSTGDVLGVIIPGSAIFEGGALKVRAKLSVDPSKAGKIADIKEGILRAVSVGAMIMASKTTEATKKKSPNDVQHVPRHVQATRWQIQEASIVPVGADPQAQTFARQEPPVEAALPQGVNAMDETQLAAIKDEAAKTERTRISEIDRAALATKADPAHVAKLKADGVALDVARAALLNAAADRDAAAPTHSQISLTRDAHDTARELVQSALLAKANPYNAKFSSEAKAGQFRGRRVADMARFLLASRGVHDAEFLNDDKAIRKAFFSHSTSDLPDLLGDSVGKVLLDTVAGGDAQYLQFAKLVKTPGLHPRKPVNLSGVSSVTAMAEGAPYKRQPLSDTAESYSVAKSGGAVEITFEALMRDDLGGLGDLAVQQGYALMDYRNQMVADLFAENSGYGPTIQGGNLFSSANANLVDTGSGGAFTVARAAALAVLLAAQTDAQGNKRPRKGKFVVVPTALGHITNALLLGEYLQTSGSSETRTNEIKGLIPITFDWLASSTKWYLFGDPARTPVLEVATPDGMDDVWSFTEEDRSGGDVRVYGCGQYCAGRIVGHRGVAMNFGA